MTIGDASGPAPPRVLISYAKDNEQHVGRVLEFADLLRRQAGIDVVLDLWARNEHRDWSEWYAAEFDAASYVLVVGSPEYRRISERPVSSDTVTALQISMLKQRLYGDRDRWLRKVLPVVLTDGRLDHLPDFVSPATVRPFAVPRITLAAVEELCRVLTSQPAHLEPALGGTAGDPPRVVAEDRASLEPATLSPVVRADLLDSALAWRGKRSGEGRVVLLLTGEGGVGKSVLLGQYLDRVERGGGAVVLVSAASVPPALALDEPSTVDRALGVAAHDEWGAAGLLALLRRLRDAHGAVTLLVDTLDLLLNKRTTAPLASVLARALEVGDVVSTCRTEEFGRHLSDARAVPRLAGRMVDFPVPPLTEPEIMAWAGGHVACLGGSTAEQTAFLESLAGGLRSSGSLRQVCALPVRLALTCQVFGRERHVPEDLTVTGLYRAYWDLRISRDLAGAGRVKEQAALDVAAQVVDESGGIALRVYKSMLDGVDDKGLRMLASEGVLRDRGASWEFFHQTFAEYGHARWLLTRGTRSAEVERFTARVAGGQTSLWPIATSLLLQADDDEYREFAQSVPADTLDGVKCHTLGALQRTTPDALANLLSGMSEQPDRLRVAVPALGDAPARHIPQSVTAVGHALLRHPDTLAGVSVAALVSLLARVDDATLLGTALDDLIAARAKLPDDAWDHYAERLLDTQGAASARVRAGALERYPSVGQLGRRAVLRMHLARARRLRDAEIVRLAHVALVRECPPLTDPEAEAVVRLLWSSPGVRADRGWRTWADVLSDDLAAGWNNGQVKYVVARADEDPVVAAEVVDDLVLGRARVWEAHVNVFDQLARRQPRATAARLLRHPAPTHRPALNAIAQCTRVFATELDRDTRARLAAWLRPARESEPRSMWRTAVSLATDDVAVHRVLLKEAAGAELPPALRNKLVLSWYTNTPRPALDDLLAELRELTGDATGDLVPVRARLEGRVVDTDGDARDWVRRCVLDGPSSVAAGAAVKTIADTLPELSPALARWAVALLATRHVDAAERLARLLRTHTSALVEPAPEVVATALDRMEVAARVAGSTNLSRALVALVTAIDRHRPLPPAEVRRVHATICSRLPLIGADVGRDTDPSAAFRDLTTFTGAVTARRLPTDEVRSLVDAVLRTLDTRGLGQKIDHDVIGLLRGFTARDPRAVDWLEDLFDAADPVVQLAIAETFLALDGGAAAGGRAARLKDRPRCPPAVAALLVTKLRT
ncbi:SEFIR domain-containing protein [Saccharothrix variisporea]|uniref:SEFIR domain-containing protein n=1 Tax=Saccharothrix variisporea TaxID=543527 RepID=A0A495XRW0_9PSEU|nr:SEFIR domain-containing protein [Saccharothrix variisporea]RKT74408.1 SEFIR domain-containing protein [Saccharothrix variisporea]